ncbi:fructose-1,6-bisphosphatase class 1-like isoform X1 [Rhodnius prolixus]|uniref:fructose-1,6-bisphosphatase class 1-like isoform X1 n=1 Tax=Rhodnius prolixus TaxID=13249 RepID=UPI003D18CA5E
MKTEDEDEPHLHSSHSQTWSFNNLERNYVTSLSQWIMREEVLNYCAFKDMSHIILSMEVTFKMIYDYLTTPSEFRWRRSRFSTEGKSIREVVNILLMENLCKQPNLFALISDTMEEPIFLSDTGSYVMFINPLEGDCEEDITLNPVGSIFSIYKRPSAYKRGFLISKKKQVLCRGVDILFSGLALYGTTATVLITNSPSRVLEFQLDNVIGEFTLLDGNVKIPKKGNFYYVNEKYAHLWNKKVCQIIYSRKLRDDGTSNFYRLLGSKCHTISKILRTGGLYALPAFTPDDAPKLLFEANPFTHILRAAGGLATTGLYSPLEICPETIHDKVPFFAGSRHGVEHVIKVLNFERSFI